MGTCLFVKRQDLSFALITPLLSVHFFSTIYFRSGTWLIVHSPNEQSVNIAISLLFMFEDEAVLDVKVGQRLLNLHLSSGSRFYVSFFLWSLHYTNLLYLSGKFRTSGSV